MYFATILVVIGHAIVIGCLSLLISLVNGNMILPLILTYLTVLSVAGIAGKHALLYCLLFDRDDFLADLDKRLEKKDEH